MQLQLQGTVVGVGCQPSKNVYFHAIQGVAETKESTIYSVGDGPFEIKIASKPGFIDARFEKINNPPPEDKNDIWPQYKLFLTLKPDTPAGNLHGNLVVNTTSKFSPTLEFRFMGQVRPGITADPSVIRIWYNEGKPAVNKTCRVKKHTDGSFKILKIKPSAKELVCRVVDLTPGKIYQLEIEWTGAKVTAMQEFKLRVETDDPAAPILEIPVVISPQS